MHISLVLFVNKTALKQMSKFPLCSRKSHCFETCALLYSILSKRKLGSALSDVVSYPPKHPSDFIEYKVSVTNVFYILSPHSNSQPVLYYNGSGNKTY